MLFDAHSHAWRRWPYDESVPDPHSRGSAESLLYEMDSHGVDRAIVVCARIGGGAGGDGFANDDNNTYVARCAATHADRLVPFVDVDSMWLSDHHTRGASTRLLSEIERTGAIGFTHYVTPSNDGWFRSEDAAEFFSAAAGAGLIASLAVSAPWFADLRVNALANPTLPFLIHHMSEPQSSDELSELLALSDVPNIGVKISGFNYTAKNRWEFPYPLGQEIFRSVSQRFGPERLYWGSDFPASRADVTYRQSIEVVRTQADFLTPHELSGVLGDNLAHLLAQPRIGTGAAPTQVSSR